MKMRKIPILVLLLTLCLLPVQSFALSLVMNGNSYYGPVQFHATIYSWGRDYATNGEPFPFDHSGSGTNRVDTYGLITVDTIDGLNPNTLAWESVWTSKPTEALEGMFWGLSDDQGYMNGDGKVVFNEINGKIALYLDTTRDLSIVNNPQTPPNGSPNWIPTDNYNATDGSLFLTANFVPGIIIGDST
ncbi:MAG: hypothetical protein PHE58_08165, partial [Candidatus Omnitrophica bacterium]|nr:hypothetical protein [Candidatus Omnitrophota bacterium]